MKEHGTIRHLHSVISDMEVKFSVRSHQDLEQYKKNMYELLDFLADQKDNECK